MERQCTYVCAIREYTLIRALVWDRMVYTYLAGCSTVIGLLNLLHDSGGGILVTGHGVCNKSTRNLLLYFMPVG